MHYVLSPEELEAASPVFRGKLGRAFCNFCFKATRISTLNYVHDRFFDFHGADFTRKLIEWCRVNYKVSGLDILDRLEPPFITISNHAYGGADGIVLIDLIGNRFPGFKVMVNEILGRIKTMEESFITVNPAVEGATSPTARSISGVRQALRQIHEGKPLGFFPSGAVSDLHWKDWLMPWKQSPEVKSVTAYDNLHRSTRDREWQDSVIRIIQKAGVPVVPIRFFDGNSLFYYLLGLIDWKVRLLRLPRECFNKRGKEFRIGIGKPISPEIQAGCRDLHGLKQLLRDSVYKMPLPEKYEVI